MRRLCSAVVILLFSLLPAFAQPATGSQPFDIVILNGKIVDGSGNPWYFADVGIRGDRIAAIGKLANAPAKKRIDAAGLVVAPGFIDMLGQSEAALLIDHRAISKLSQGITTEITGEGGSIAPQNALTLNYFAAGAEGAPDGPRADQRRFLCRYHRVRSSHHHRQSDLRRAGAAFAGPWLPPA